MRLLPLISLLIIAAPFAALAAYVIHSSRQKKYSRSPLNLVGRVGRVERALEPEGFVLIEGELWRARVSGCESFETVGRSVRVVGASGCVLEVEPDARRLSEWGGRGVRFPET
jgi:membrane protein implicated in regulation of membrane protease activity